jgi:hypothetical protein
VLRWIFGTLDKQDATPDSAGAAGEALLDQIAAAVVRRRLGAPAVFFLEMNRPLAFLAGQATHVLVPFLAPLVGLGRMQEIARVLENRSSVDRLLERIERLESGTAPDGEGSAAA